jgi:hypothetical protein
VSRSLPSTSHRAMAGVNATTTVFRFPIFWETRTECLFKIRDKQPQQGVRISIPAPPLQLDNDSDSDSEDSGSSKSGARAHYVSSSSSTGSEDEDITGNVTLGDTWEKECDFQSPDPNPKQLFEKQFTATSRSRRSLMGMQCTNIEVSTPLRAWRRIFTNSLLDKIVKYTNEIGVVHAK